MCGIAGFTHSGRVPGRRIIGKIIEDLSHRGPDQQGTYESAGISLGAVRLKIIDLQAGDQPMVNPGRAIVLGFNGEIYNHAELRAELERRGHRFGSRCDTEVALRAFEEWDIGCFSRLRGMFALAVWCEREKRLVLARDRIGIKPLYWRRLGNDIHFGSEMQAILGHPAIPRRLDLDALEDYLSLNYVPGPATLVEGVEKLPPGHWLEWRCGDIRIEPYWRLEFRPEPKWTLPSAIEALDSLLASAVREHLVSDVPLGVWASGGIDSSTVLHYAAQATASRLKTFSISFSGRSFDESPWFRRMAAQYGTDHHEFDLNPEVELESVIDRLADYEPVADAGALPVWFLSRMTRQHVTVALSGDGGDELFGGYVTYMADRYARGLRRIPLPLRRAMLAALERWLPVSDEKIGFEYKLKRFLEGSSLPPDQAHFFWNGTFSQSQKNRLSLSTGTSGAQERLTRLENPAGFLNRFLYLDQMFYLPDDILVKVDSMSMAHSLEVRPPLLDHRIIEFAASLPQSLKIRGLTQKYLLKQVMKGRLPDAVLRRGKAGFDVPLHDWFRSVLRPMLLDTLNPRALQRVAVFEPNAVQDLIRAHLERRANFGYHLWGLLILFRWIERWGVEVPLPDARRRHPVPSMLAAR